MLNAVFEVVLIHTEEESTMLPHQPLKQTTLAPNGEIKPCTVPAILEPMHAVRCHHTFREVPHKLH